MPHQLNIKIGFVRVLSQAIAPLLFRGQCHLYLLSQTAAQHQPLEICSNDQLAVANIGNNLDFITDAQPHAEQP